MSHKWLSNTKASPSGDLHSSPPMDAWDSALMQKMSDIGFDTTLTREGLEKDVRNHVTTTYKMLNQQQDSAGSE